MSARVQTICRNDRELAERTIYFLIPRGDEDDATSTMSMQMEEFYAGAKDADYIIYNSTIEGELSSVDDLLAKSPLFGSSRPCRKGMFTVHQRICISQQCLRWNDHHRISAGC